MREWVGRCCLSCSFWILNVILLHNYMHTKQNPNKQKINKQNSLRISGKDMCFQISEFNNFHKIVTF